MFGFFIFKLYNLPVLQMVTYKAQVSSSVYSRFVYLAVLMNGVIVGPVTSLQYTFLTCYRACSACCSVRAVDHPT